LGATGPRRTWLCKFGENIADVRPARFAFSGFGRCYPQAECEICRDPGPRPSVAQPPESLPRGLLQCDPAGKRLAASVSRLYAASIERQHCCVDLSFVIWNGSIAKSLLLRRKG
jgi:hypothetical protein